MRGKYFIKFGLTIILLAFLFYKIDISDVVSILLSLNMDYYIISILIVPILYIIRTFRWEILLDSINIRSSFINLLKIMIIGVFYGLITPGKVGELGRAYHLNGQRTKIIPTIIIEKITDIFSLIMLSVVTIVLFFNDYPDFKLLILICICMVFLGTWMLSSRRITRIFTKPLKIAEDNVDIFNDSFLILMKNKNLILKTLLLAIFYYIINYIVAIFLLMSLDVDPSTAIVLPLVILMGNIPITISGLGLRESVGAICFILLGEPGAYGISFSLLLFITVTLLPGIIGYVLTISDRTA